MMALRSRQLGDIGRHHLIVFKVVEKVQAPLIFIAQFLEMLAEYKQVLVRDLYHFVPVKPGEPKSV